MLKRRRAVSLLLLVPFVVTPCAWAHDDPNFWADRKPPYVGPGWRAGDGGAPPIAFPSDGIQLMSWLPLGDFGPQIVSGDDCWGYTSPSGREYAMIGLSHGTGFVEVTDPGSAQIVGYISGPTSTWRDIKVYDHFAYAVSEGGGGIQVFDLSNIDSAIVQLVNTVFTGDGTSASHNVAINTDSGYLYRAGGGGFPYMGIRVYSLANAINPMWVGSWHGKYVHDVQVVSYTEGPFAGKEIAFCCANNTSGGGDPSVYIVDVTDKTDIQVISFIDLTEPPIFSHPAVFSHQGWLSPDRQYFYFGDEADEGTIGNPTMTRIIDVSDLTNPTQVGTFTNGNSARDHNLYTLGNLIFEANYRSGVRVYDATDPLAPVEIAWFDTDPASDSANYNALWNVYPYFPSGTFIGSDIEKGLFVWRMGFTPPEALLTAGFPHNAAKNRYVSFTTPSDPNSVAYQVEMTEGPGATGVVGWVGTPYDPSCRNDDGTPNGGVCTGVDYLARVVADPVYRVWEDGRIVHVGDCEIVPVATYVLRATRDEVEFSDPLEVSTINKPGPLFHGDVVGEATETEYTPPQGVVNISDVQATLFNMQGNPIAPHKTWTDVTGLGGGAPPNFLINISDVQQILKGGQGDTYLESNLGLNVDPADCP